MIEVFIFVGKAAITIIATLIGYIIIVKVEYFKTKIASPAVLTLIFAVLAYSLSCLFMSVWSMAARTILHCYFVDEEINDGSAIMCPEYLREFFAHKKG